MEHAVFGRIEPFHPGWTGRVQIGFFSGHDARLLADHGERLGLGDWRTPADQGQQQGEFALEVVSQGSSVPSAAQEMPFATLSKIRM